VGREWEESGVRGKNPRKEKNKLENKNEQ